jgi:hypothetical protein
VLLNDHDPSRLLPGEPESISIGATYVAGSGWDCNIHIRRQFQTWAEAAHGHYEMLSTPELVTLLDAALSAELKV